MHHRVDGNIAGEDLKLLPRRSLAVSPSSGQQLPRPQLHPPGLRVAKWPVTCISPNRIALQYIALYFALLSIFHHFLTSVVLSPSSPLWQFLHIHTIFIYLLRNDAPFAYISYLHIRLSRPMKSSWYRKHFCIFCVRSFISSNNAFLVFILLIIHITACSLALSMPRLKGGKRKYWIFVPTKIQY